MDNANDATKLKVGFASSDKYQMKVSRKGCESVISYIMTIRVKSHGLKPMAFNDVIYYNWLSYFVWQRHHRFIWTGGWITSMLLLLKYWLKEQIIYQWCLIRPRTISTAKGWYNLDQGSMVLKIHQSHLFQKRKDWYSIHRWYDSCCTTITLFPIASSNIRHSANATLNTSYRLPVCKQTLNSTKTEPLYCRKR